MVDYLLLVVGGIPESQYDRSKADLESAIAQNQAQSDG